MCLDTPSLFCLELIAHTYFFPSKVLMIALPIFLSRPALLVGIPVSRANFCFIWVIPNALFNENDTPGIFMAFSSSMPVVSKMTLLFSTNFFLFDKIEQSRCSVSADKFSKNPPTPPNVVREI